ncbi:MAG: exodeoxyribonuclease VII small subunit [Olsenella sp.]|jgi:exodeoxyribonuclease VII small subunit
MARFDASSYDSFEDITSRLEKIVAQVKDNDVSLEQSLDLLDEAITLGSRAVELVDVEELSDREVAASAPGAEAASGADAPEGASEGGPAKGAGGAAGPSGQEGDAPDGREGA